MRKNVSPRQRPLRRIVAALRRWLLPARARPPCETPDLAQRVRECGEW